MNATLDLTAFYALLAKTPRDWKVLDDSRIRRCPEGYQCPISSIGNRHLMYAWQVGSAAGMQAADMSDVIAAADLEGNYKPTIRAELLRACGLETTS